MRVLAKTTSIFNLFKQAIRGDEQSFTEGSINKAIFMLSIPMILEMAMESLFAVVDIFYVSRLNSSDAVAVVGLTESILTIVYSIAIGLSMGATAMVARRVGEKNTQGAAVAALQSIYLGIGIASLIGILGFFFYEEVLVMMGASSEVIASGSGYTRWMFTGNVSVMLLFLINAVFRGAGNAAVAMRSLWFANLLNIIIDPMFIFGFAFIPAFGVEGAAIATNIGRAAGVVYQVIYLVRGKGILKINQAPKKIDWPIIGRLLKVSAGGTGQFLIASASWIFLVRIMSGFGSAALAGYTIAVRVIMFTLLPSWGMSNASATLVGQNLGAGQPDRAEQSVWKTGFFNMIFLSLVMIIFLMFSGSILGFFTGEQEVAFYGMRCLQIIALGYIFYGYGMVIAQSFNGAGDTRTPTILNLFAFWFLQIPLAYLFAKQFEFGPEGVYIAIPIAESALTIAGIIIFRKGKWKTVTI
ncbi:MAG TPA: MATE family efflux transporter [Cyclobacteriaceae bacterium]|nr:MATE family efflux transporter [Cyclobacteriaceae bacterium]